MASKRISFRVSDEIWQELLKRIENEKESPHLVAQRIVALEVTGTTEIKLESAGRPSNYVEDD